MIQRIDPSLIPDSPSLEFENALWDAGCQTIAGVDEAGRGCLAGPVAAAILVLSPDSSQIGSLAGARDSKTLSQPKRNQIRLQIENSSIDWGVGFADNQEIDRLGILPATRLAVWRALDQLKIRPDHLLVDYITLPDCPLPQTRLVKGDARSLAIAGASILAKTHRDDWMLEVAEVYPEYGFASNKGYGTPSHRQILLELGPCPIHRRSFAPLKHKQLPLPFS